MLLFRKVSLQKLVGKVVRSQADLLNLLPCLFLGHPSTLWVSPIQAVEYSDLASAVNIL